ncbi:hypothetical protein ACOSQ3_012524 [Xanthoceras sorbifolium]
MTNRQKGVIAALETHCPNSSRRYSLSLNAYKYMMDIPQKHWCMHVFDKHIKFGHTTNNVTEAFDS